MIGNIISASARGTAPTTGNGVLFNTFMVFLPWLRDDVDHVRFAPLDRVHPALESGRQQLRIGNRASLSLHAVALCHLAVIDVRIPQSVSNMAAISSASAHASH